MQFIKSTTEKAKKILTKNVVKTVCLVIGLFMFFSGLLVAIYGLFGVFFLEDLFYVYQFIYTAIFIGGAFCGIKTATLKDNPEKDRKYALSFLTSHICLVFLYVLEQVVSLASGHERDVLSKFYEGEEWIQTMFSSFTTFFVLFLIFNIIVASSILLCCFAYSIFSFINVKYTALEIDAPYQMVKTEDEDSEEALVELNEDELKKNNEEIIFVEKEEKPEEKNV